MYVDCLTFELNNDFVVIVAYNVTVCNDFHSCILLNYLIVLNYLICTSVCRFACT